MRSELGEEASQRSALTGRCMSSSASLSLSSQLLPRDPRAAPTIVLMPCSGASLRQVMCGEKR